MNARGRYEGRIPSRRDRRAAATPIGPRTRKLRSSIFSVRLYRSGILVLPHETTPLEDPEQPMHRGGRLFHATRKIRDAQPLLELPPAPRRDPAPSRATSAFPSYLGHWFMLRMSHYVSGTYKPMNSSHSTIWNSIPSCKLRLYTGRRLNQDPSRGIFLREECYLLNADPAGKSVVCSRGSG